MQPRTRIAKPMSIALRTGGSCSIRSLHLHENNSMLHDKPMFDMFLKTDKVALFNTRCWFFHNHPNGCKHGDACRFLHNEEPICVPIFHDGMEESRTRDVLTKNPVCLPKLVPIDPGPVVDAVLYMKNLPPSGGDLIVRTIAEKYGTVTQIDLLKSNLRNGRRCGFLHMTSEAQAKAVAEVICTTFDDRERLFAKYERTDPPKPAFVIKENKKTTRAPKQVMVDEEGFICTPVRVKKSRATGKSVAVSSAPVAEVPVEDKDTVADNAPVETETVVNDQESKALPALEPDDSPVSVLGMNPWREADRSTRLRNELAHLRLDKANNNAFQAPKAFELDAIPKIDATPKVRGAVVLPVIKVPLIRTTSPSPMTNAQIAVVKVPLKCKTLRQPNEKPVKKVIFVEGIAQHDVFDDEKLAQPLVMPIANEFVPENWDDNLSEDGDWSEA